MITIADKMMKRIRARGRRKWVCAARDFPDLGGRAAVDHALSRRAKAADLRRALPDGIKEDLARRSASLPGLAVAIARSLADGGEVARSRLGASNVFFSPSMLGILPTSTAP